MERSKELIKMLGVCFESQKTYGQDASKIESLVKIFDFILTDYDIEDIRQAFMNHLQNKTDFPTPACIMELLKPRGVDISAAAYVQACKYLEAHKESRWTIEEGKFSAIKKAYENLQLESSELKQEWDTLDGEGTRAILDGVKRVN